MSNHRLVRVALVFEAIPQTSPTSVSWPAALAADGTGVTWQTISELDIRQAALGVRVALDGDAARLIQTTERQEQDTIGLESQWTTTIATEAADDAS